MIAKAYNRWTIHSKWPIKLSWWVDYISPTVCTIILNNQKIIIFNNHRDISMDAPHLPPFGFQIRCNTAGYQ